MVITIFGKVSTCNMTQNTTHSSDWKDISIAFVIIMIKLEVSTFPIVIICFRGCVSEMFVTSYFVTYCIHIPGKPGICFHYYCTVYDFSKSLFAIFAQVIHCVHHILHIHKYTDNRETPPPQPCRHQPHLKLGKKINTNINAQYTKAKRAKGGKKPRKVYGPLGCRSRIFLVRNNQCRECRCSGNKVHKYTEIISLNWIMTIIVITTVKWNQ